VIKTKNDLNSNTDVNIHARREEERKIEEKMEKIAREKEIVINTANSIRLDDFFDNNMSMLYQMNYLIYMCTLRKPAACMTPRYNKTAKIIKQRKGYIKRRRGGERE
jgi:hypothetical protein